MQLILWIVVPCYNEEAVLPQTLHQLGQLLDNMIDTGLVNSQSQVVCVDDCSTDGTWNIIEQSKCGGLRLNKNCGHQNALMAGMDMALGKANVVITIDADLQDDPNVIPRMVELYQQGADVVYGVRNDRSCDTIAKRLSANAFYRVIRWFNAPVIANHADFRLISQRAIERLTHYDGRRLFLRGIIPQMGFPSAQVSYVRCQRQAGESKYTLWRMLRLAADGFSTVFWGRFSDMPKTYHRYQIVQIINISKSL